MLNLEADMFCSLELFKVVNKRRRNIVTGPIGKNGNKNSEQFSTQFMNLFVCLSVLLFVCLFVLLLMLLYVNRNHKDHEGRESRTATSTFTQLLSSASVH